MPDVAPVEYAVPRNPAVPAPGFGDVIASEANARDRQGRPAGRRVRVYRGHGIPPESSSLIDRGPLLGFERGWLFLATKGDPAWRETLREVGEIASKRAGGAALELAMDVAVAASGVVGKAFRSVTVDNFVGEMTGYDPVKTQIRDLERRALSAKSMVLPYVDIVRVQSERIRRWARLGTIDCSVVTLETGAGETRTVCVTGAGAPLAAVCMQRRFDQEFQQIAGVAWSELLGLQELWRSLVGQYGDPSAVAVGRVWDDWKHAVQARMASRQVTPAQVTSLTLQRIGPWLDHYRKIPPALERVQAAEALA